MLDLVTLTALVAITTLGLTAIWLLSLEIKAIDSAEIDMSYPPNTTVTKGL